VALEPAVDGGPQVGVGEVLAEQLGGTPVGLGGHGLADVVERLRSVGLET